jgi:Serine/threonine protein kinase
MFIKHNACILSENYEIGCKLGSGAYGVVRMAKHKLTNQTRAIKSINKTKVSSDQLSSSKFVSEIDNLMNSDHPNIVRLYEFYEDEKY